MIAMSAWAAPPVLVIAVDAFRHDFAARDHAPAFLALQKEGAWVEATEPSFPSTTFPNFHTMATGLHPGHHGLVSMSFYDRALGKSFYYTKNSREGSWYGGMPIWLLAEDAGIRSATFFWPGTDAGIQGRNPSYFRRYDGRVPHEERVAQVMEWLQMSEDKRPGFIVVYFSDVDAAGHATGPDSPETRAAIAKVDKTVGELVEKARAARKDINIVVLSDHGQIGVESVIDISKKADLSGCRAANEAPTTMLYCDDPERVRAELVRNASEVTVYRRKETPAHWFYRDNPRVGDLVIVPNTPSIIYAIPPGDTEAHAVPALKGMHGYDPRRYPEMGGTLIGVGPAFQAGKRIPTIQNVDVFALLCRLLGVKMPAGVDANPAHVAPLFK
jgi:alkaline phosphatase D